MLQHRAVQTTVAAAAAAGRSVYKGNATTTTKLVGQRVLQQVCRTSSTCSSRRSSSGCSGSTGIRSLRTTTTTTTTTPLTYPYRITIPTTVATTSSSSCNGSSKLFRYGRRVNNNSGYGSIIQRQQQQQQQRSLSSSSSSLLSTTAASTNWNHRIVNNNNHNNSNNTTIINRFNTVAAIRLHAGTYYFSSDATTTTTATATTSSTGKETNTTPTTIDPTTNDILSPSSTPPPSQSEPEYADLRDKEETPEEKEARLIKWGKEYGVNLDGSPIEPGEDIDDDDDDDGSPPNHSDEELYGSLPKGMDGKMDTSQHRSTNIGIPTRPEDPVAVDGRTVRVMYCYSKYEIMEGTRFEDNVGQFDLPLNYEALKKEALEFYNEEETSEYFTLEYYHKKKWVPLTEDCYDILLHYHKEQILHQEDYQTMFFIRMPFMYDTSDYPDEDPNASNFSSLADAAMGNLKSGKTPKPPPTIQDRVIKLLREIQKRKFTRYTLSPSPYDVNADIMAYKLVVPHSFLDDDDGTFRTVENDNDNKDVDDEYEYEPVLVSTRQYILNCCTSDYDLRDILLLNVNALSHMVRCLHYDIYWNFPLPKRQDIDDEEEQKELDEIDGPINRVTSEDGDDDEEEERQRKKDYQEHDDDFDDTNNTNKNQQQQQHHSHDHHHHEHDSNCRH